MKTYIQYLMYIEITQILREEVKIIYKGVLRIGDLLFIHNISSSLSSLCGLLKK